MNIYIHDAYTSLLMSSDTDIPLEARVVNGYLDS